MKFTARGQPRHVVRGLRPLYTAVSETAAKAALDQLPWHNDGMLGGRRLTAAWARCPRGVKVFVVALLSVVIGLYVDALKTVVTKHLPIPHIKLPGWVLVPLGILIITAAAGISLPLLDDLGKRLRPGSTRAEAIDNKVTDGALRGRLLTTLRYQYGVVTGQSLLPGFLLTPTLDEELEMVARTLPVLASHQPLRPLPSTANLLTEFNRVGGSRGDGLLLLGDAGVGKTTELLRFAIDMIDRTADDAESAVPVIVPLSTWTEGQPLEDWLARELHELYKFPEPIARRWLREGQLLPLLDGLDEISDVDARTACVDAINRFIANDAVTVVVASRHTDYEVLPIQLQLATAVTLRPLDPNDVMQRLSMAGPELSGVTAALGTDPELVELLRTPLLLGMVVMAYRGRTAQQVVLTGTVTARREAVLSEYVSRQLQTPRSNRHGRRESPPYRPEQTTRWLTALAQNLDSHGLSVFLPEHMQPDWLGNRRGGGLVKYSAGITSGLLVGGIIGFTFLVIGGIGGLIFMGLVTGGFAFFVGSLISEELDGPARIQPAEQLRWSWRKAKQNLMISAIIALLFAIPLGLGIWGGSHSWWDGLAFAAGIEFSIGASIAFAAGLEPGQLPTRLRPNEGIRRSLRNGMLAWLVTALLVGIPIGMLVIVFGGPAAGLIVGCIVGSVVGFGVGLTRGLGAAAKHGVLRWLLWRRGLAPLRYVRWLNYVTSLRLLYWGFGGGYLFLHRLLQEHFATAITGEPPLRDAQHDAATRSPGKS